MIEQAVNTFTGVESGKKRVTLSGTSGTSEPPVRRDDNLLCHTVTRLGDKVVELDFILALSRTNIPRGGNILLLKVQVLEL